ncbi:MAG: CHAP domain-containing protein [Mycobacteriales bacterium]
MRFAVWAGLVAALVLAAVGTAGAATPRDDTALVLRDLTGLGYLPGSATKAAWTPAVAQAWQAFGHDRCLTVTATGPDPAGLAALRGQVAAVQRKVRAKPTGDFREATGWLVAFWQYRHHRHRTGVADAATMRALRVERVRSCPPPPAPDYRAAIVRTALGQVGTAEQPLGSNCTKYGPCEEWCADFASWVWRQAGVPDFTGYPFSGDLYRWGLRHGLSRPIAAGARPGDLVVYGTGPQNTGTSVHVAVVVAVRGAEIQTVDGNSGRHSDVVAHTGWFRPANAYGYVSPVSG